MGEKPPSGGQLQAGAVSQPWWMGQTFHSSGVSLGRRKKQVEGETLFSAGATFPWHPAGRCISTDLRLRGVQQRGEGSLGCLSTMDMPAQGTHSWRELSQRMLPRCPPDVPRWARLAMTPWAEVAPRGVKLPHVTPKVSPLGHHSNSCPARPCAGQGPRQLRGSCPRHCHCAGDRDKSAITHCRGGAVQRITQPRHQTGLFFTHQPGDQGGGGGKRD